MTGSLIRLGRDVREAPIGNLVTRFRRWHPLVIWALAPRLAKPEENPVEAT